MLEETGSEYLQYAHSLTNRMLFLVVFLQYPWFVENNPMAAQHLQNLYNETTSHAGRAVLKNTMAQLFLNQLTQCFDHSNIPVYSLSDNLNLYLQDKYMHIYSYH